MDKLITDAITHSMNTLGYDHIRPHQKDILVNILKGRDSFLVAPTGSGKSLIFEALPFGFTFLNEYYCEKLIIVVSPLVSLMKMQAKGLQERGISAAYLNDMKDPSSPSIGNELICEKAVREGKIKILFASPESLLGQYRNLLADLANANLVCCLAIDEAHCILKYGYGRKTKHGKKKSAFRPAYGRLLEVRAIVGDIPLVALTATASQEAREKITQCLNMGPCFNLVLSPKKDNMTYIVHSLPKDYDMDEYFGWLKQLIIRDKDELNKILLFFHKVSRQSEVYEYLDFELGHQGHVGEPPHSDRTHIFEMYHMKTDDSVKESILSQFSSKGNMRCVLASSSFSMGLDIPDITYVIHFGPAMDLDDFLQETGRGGRLGQKCFSILLTYPRCLNGINISPAMKQYVKTSECRRITLLKDYDESISPITPKHNCCDNCAKMCDCEQCPISPLCELGIVKDINDEISSDSDADNQGDVTESDSDSDIEAFNRTPILVLSDSD